MARVDKVAEAIKQEVSIIIHDKLKDPRLGFVTITGVEVSADLRSAKIFFSVLGKDEDHKKTKDALDSALGFIRGLVSKRINLKFAPEIIFREDRSSEYSVRIQEVLDQISGLDKQAPLDIGKEALVKKKGKRELKKSARVHKGTR